MVQVGNPVLIWDGIYLACAAMVGRWFFSYSFQGHSKKWCSAAFTALH